MSALNACTPWRMPAAVQWTGALNRGRPDYATGGWICGVPKRLTVTCAGGPICDCAECEIGNFRGCLAG